MKPLSEFIKSTLTGIGATYIMTKGRVHLLGVPFLKAVKCISWWGPVKWN